MLTPKEMLHKGIFGGTYFSRIVSHKGFPGDWFHGLDSNFYLSEKAYFKLMETAIFPVTKDMLLSFLEANWSNKDFYSLAPISTNKTDKFLDPTETINTLMGWDKEASFSIQCGSKWTSKHTPIEMVWLGSYPENSNVMLIERDITEEPRITRVVVHVSNGVHVHHQGNKSHDDHHHRTQFIN